MRLCVFVCKHECVCAREEEHERVCLCCTRAGGLFELPARSHSSLDFTSTTSSQRQGRPATNLPPRPGTSLMAQRSAKSVTCVPA